MPSHPDHENCRSETNQTFYQTPCPASCKPATQSTLHRTTLSREKGGNGVTIILRGQEKTITRMMKINVRMDAIIVLCSSLYLTFTGASEMERRLHQKLFENYNLKVRPARSWEETVMVRVGMTLSQLVSLNEKNGEMTTNVFMNLAWTDYRLSWDPEEYDDIKVLRIPPNKVWRPDIYLINNNDGQFDVALYVNVLVYSDGTVNWLPPAIYRSSCSIEVAYFPFDWQNCSMVFRSYTYDASEVDLQYYLDDYGEEIQEIVIDENAFTENGEWAICHKPSRKNVKDGLYEDITFYLIIERKPLFYIINIIVPCILTSVLAIFVFYLPPGAGEKMTLSISVLIALTVFMLLLADKVPETSLGIPIIVNYVMFTMILVTFSVILSVVVLNLHHRTPSTHIMPKWVRKVFIQFLPKYIGMEKPHQEGSVAVAESNDNIPVPSFNGRRPAGEYFFRKINPDLVLPWKGGGEGTVQLQRYYDTDSYCLILPPNLKSAIAAVTYMAEQLKKQDTDDTMTGDWQFIALVVDRLFLWLFVVITTLGTLAMFLDASFNYTPDNPFP
ncbi:cholinergic receptor, nicotinic, beta 1 (muscle) like [Lampris incognitus]|uniref:cholinergic receptor, nicotinic, beta 1 (muscle) like n=1 Tax=Lampris incognitus TaxID=2546036 RepID=UPI0024B54E34|nr:cholinergic receptor, nicotinic, beta 1 (muscle) like [Lampris incognitus]